ncbi:MAG: cold-shock protein [Gammaproteobacteria bacterium]|nr:cold-shock protein [Gammaproteobacteria bacterium]
MEKGVVRWFNENRGYGFIVPHGGGDDVFAHYSAIEMDGYKTLREGQIVEFILELGPKGPEAYRIRAIG